jgi:group I intron endonuclease
MVIYKITNLINNKIYIGKSKYNNEKYLGSGIALENAKKKYGIHNFNKEIIEEVDCEKKLNLLEKFWIHKLKSYDKKIGYNIAEGGNGGNTRAGFTDDELEEYYNKLSYGVKNSDKYLKAVEKKTGVKKPKHSEKMKKLYKEGRLNVGKNTKPFSDETKLKISEKNKGKKRTDETKYKIAKSKFKEVEKLTVYGEYIESYSSIDEASKKNNVNRCCISDACWGKQKTAGGYKWRFKKDNI